MSDFVLVLIIVIVEQIINITINKQEPPQTSMQAIENDRRQNTSVNIPWSFVSSFLHIHGDS